MNTWVKMVSGTANKGSILYAMTDMPYQKRSYETDLCCCLHCFPLSTSIIERKSLCFTYIYVEDFHPAA